MPDVHRLLLKLRGRHYTMQKGKVNIKTEGLLLKAISMRTVLEGRKEGQPGVQCRLSVGLKMEVPPQAIICVLQTPFVVARVRCPK
jgi:hypothetical protein